MPTIISRGRELIRISPKDNKRLEYSTNGGVYWNTRFAGQSRLGTFYDLMDSGREILATTSEGLFYSTNNGQTWQLRSR